MWKDAKWLKIPQTEIEEKKIYFGDLNGRFAYFRCEVKLPENAGLVVDISANSRYRLWVNEQPVLSGPCKGDSYRQYYETVDLSRLLVAGKNVFCVQVLYSVPDDVESCTDERAAIYGVIGQRCGHRLAIEGDIYNASGELINTITTGKVDWRVWVDGSFYLKSCEITRYLGATTEDIDFQKTLSGWRKKDFDMTSWKEAEGTVEVMSAPFAGIQPRFRMKKREIPLMYEKEDTFDAVYEMTENRELCAIQTENFKIAPFQTKKLLLDAGTLKNGYPSYLFRGGKAAKVSCTYFEKFGGEGADIRRTDYKNGKIEGLTDTVILDGEEICYQPFWVRTFRFVCMTIVTEEQELYCQIPTFRKTGYPLEIQSSVTSTASWVRQVWDMCVRTLENCMMETYMDCPYYEQLQFAMDTRLEALYTYAVCDDAALPRKALIDFHYGMQPEGLMCGKYPAAYLQILSTFSLHYIIMLWEYYEQTKNMQILTECYGDIDRILGYYHSKIGEDGLVGNLGFWEFVDWQEAWRESMGEPAALFRGPSTIINLMYAYALGCGENMNLAIERSSLAKEYGNRRKAILEQVQKQCWDEENGMYKEGPDFNQYSQHAQSWAILNGMADTVQAKKILKNAIRKDDCLKCTFPAAFEWFRALEQAEMYDEIRFCLNDWIGLLDLDCTTCPETPKNARSDCHAWSALPVYEMMRVMAGVKPEKVGWEHVRIEPHLFDLPDLKGNVATPYGTIEFEYIKMCENKYRYCISVPIGVQADFYRNEKKIELKGGGNYEFTM